MPTTVGSILRAAVADAAELVGITEVKADGTTGRSWTYGELHRGTECLALGLLTRFVPRRTHRHMVTQFA